MAPSQGGPARERLSESHNTPALDPRRAEPEEDKSSSSAPWPASVLAGLTRSVTYSLKFAGITSKAWHRMMTKSAFLHIGKRTALHAASAPALRQSPLEPPSPSKLSWATRLSEFTKSSILGIAVFGLYEYLTMPRKGGSRLKDRDHFETTTTITAAHYWPLWIHGGAGALAGATQSIILDGWEVGRYWIHYYRQHGTAGIPHSHHLRLINTPLVVRRLVHHSLGYMTLFGTYEGLRRWGHRQVASMREESAATTKEESAIDRLPLFGWELDWIFLNYNTTATTPWMISMLAGGVAGQAHYLVSHYLRQWHLYTDHHHHHSTHHHHHKVQHVSVGNVLRAFGPTALSFLAFQYGGELTAQWLALEEEENLA